MFGVKIYELQADGEDRCIGTIALRDGKLIPSSSNGVLLQMLHVAVAGPKSGGKPIAAKDDPEIFLDCLRYRYHGMYLRATQPQELVEEDAIAPGEEKSAVPTVVKGSWEEGEHPRDHGKFASEEGEQGPGGKPGTRKDEQTPNAQADKASGKNTATATADSPGERPRPREDAPAKPKANEVAGKPFPKTAKIPPTISEHAKKVIAGSNAAQRSALRDYTIFGYADLNAAMRRCPPDFSCVSGDDKEMMEQLESLLDGQKLPEPVTVYRGLDLSPRSVRKLLDAARALKESGSTDYRMPSISSTTFQPDAAADLGDSLTFHIRAKSGLYVESLSAASGEHELIQSSRCKYRVVGVDDSVKVAPGRRKPVIYLEEV